ncbi:hypothetical protein pdam_00009263 [Pocillopora damicornis]|uniref:Peptidase M12B propeptide domain-containing protein n=1 Tax=Pocillopora damicornis TaxID=46731 RepID=A0A3M6TTV9_POCDA|nr:hypothetical protein pdam_00009263 [Pocillopora damicornis]
MGIFFLGALMSDDQSFSIMLLQGGHVDTASYRLAAFDKDWTLDVKRNKELIPPSFAVRTFANDGSEIIQKGVADHCHYQGSIRGLKDSYVVLNTCSGLRYRIIDDGRETFYIKPEIGKEIRRSISGDIDEFYKPFLTTDETRYNELAICVDFEMVIIIYYSKL